MPTTAEILVDTLIDWGIETIFGMPGDGINGIMEAIRKAQEQKHGNSEQRLWIYAAAPEPQQLRNDDVRRDDAPVRPRVRPCRPVVDHEHLERTAAIPRCKRLDRVGVCEDQTGPEHHLRAVVQMAFRDQVVKSVDSAQRDRQDQNHGESGKNRAGDEIGRKDGRVPAGQNRNGEVEADDCVHRQHQGRRQTCQQ